MMTVFTDSAAVNAWNSRPTKD